jgi:hypothetical protein
MTRRVGVGHCADSRPLPRPSLPATGQAPRSAPSTTRSRPSYGATTRLSPGGTTPIGSSPLVARRRPCTLSPRRSCRSRPSSPTWASTASTSTVARRPRRPTSASFGTVAPRTCPAGAPGAGSLVAWRRACCVSSIAPRRGISCARRSTSFSTGRCSRPSRRRGSVALTCASWSTRSATSSVTRTRASDATSHVRAISRPWRPRVSTTSRLGARRIAATSRTTSSWSTSVTDSRWPSGPGRRTSRRAGSSDTRTSAMPFASQPSRASS